MKSIETPERFFVQFLTLIGARSLVKKFFAGSRSTLDKDSVRKEEADLLLHEPASRHDHTQVDRASSLDHPVAQATMS